MLGVGCGPQVGPFPSRPIMGSIRGEGTPPPTNPSRHLKKERSVLPLKWLLKEGRGRSPTAVVAAAAATAAATPFPGHWFFSTVIATPLSSSRRRCRRHRLRIAALPSSPPPSPPPSPASLWQASPPAPPPAPPSASISLHLPAIFPFPRKTFLQPQPSSRPPLSIPPIPSPAPPFQNSHTKRFVIPTADLTSLFPHLSFPATPRHPEIPSNFWFQPTFTPTPDLHSPCWDSIPNFIASNPFEFRRSCKNPLPEIPRFPASSSTPKFPIFRDRAHLLPADSHFLLPNQFRGRPLSLHTRPSRPLNSCPQSEFSTILPGLSLTPPNSFSLPLPFPRSTPSLPNTVNSPSPYPFLSIATLIHLPRSAVVKTGDPSPPQTRIPPEFCVGVNQQLPVPIPLTCLCRLPPVPSPNSLHSPLTSLLSNGEIHSLRCLPQAGVHPSFPLHRRLPLWVLPSQSPLLIPPPPSARVNYLARPPCSASGPPPGIAFPTASTLPPVPLPNRFSAYCWINPPDAWLRPAGSSRRVSPQTWVSWVNPIAQLVVPVPPSRHSTLYQRVSNHPSPRAFSPPSLCLIGCVWVILFPSRTTLYARFRVPSTTASSHAEDPLTPHRFHSRILLSRIASAICLYRTRRLSTTPRPTGHPAPQVSFIPSFLSWLPFEAFPCSSPPPSDDVGRVVRL